MAKTKLGFEIGSGSLKLAQCSGRSVDRVSVEPLPENLIQNGRVISYEAMVDFIRGAVRRNRFSGKKFAAVVLPVGAAFLRRVTLPAMSEQQLRYNLPYEFRDYTNQSKESFFYDYALLGTTCNDAGEPVEIDLLAAAVPKELIAEYRAMFRRAGLRLKVAAPAECAYTNLIRSRLQTQAGAEIEDRCIIHLGHTATYVYIFTGDRFETAHSIEIGLLDIDRAIASVRGVDEHIARTHRVTDHDGALSLEEVRDVYNAIAVAVMKVINFYSFNNGGKRLEHAYFCGDGSVIEGLVETISQTTQLNIHSIGELMPSSANIDEADAELCALAIGITQQ